MIPAFVFNVLPFYIRRKNKACTLNIEWPGANCYSGSRTNLLEARVLGCDKTCFVLIRHWTFSPKGEPSEETISIGRANFTYNKKRKGAYLESPVILAVLREGDDITVGNLKLRIPCKDEKLPTIVKVEGLPEGAGLRLGNMVLVYTELVGELVCGEEVLKLEQGLVTGWSHCNVLVGESERSLSELIQLPICTFSGSRLNNS